MEATRVDAKIEKYAAGGYCVTMPDGSQYEADTVAEAVGFARDEGADRAYSVGSPDKFVVLTRKGA